MAKKSDSKVVEATGAAAAAAANPEGFNAGAIQDAMSQAAADAQAEGVTDPEEVKKRMADARERIKKDSAPKT